MLSDIAEAVTMMIPCQLVRGDWLYQIGSEADEIFFIVRDNVLHVRRRSIAPHSLIYDSYGFQRHVLVVCQDDGEIEISWSDTRIPRSARQSYAVLTATTGQCVGDEGLLDTDYTAATTRLFSATAKTPASLYFIRRDDLATLFYSYPSVQEACRKAITLKMERWQRETEKVLKQRLAEGDDGSAQPPVAAYTYEPRGELPLPVFTAATTRLHASADTNNVRDGGEATLNDGGSVAQEAAGREPSNRELAAKVDALDAKLNKIVEMMLHANARFEHRK
jgi:CRP-like cAMP-binding protein